MKISARRVGIYCLLSRNFVLQALYLSFLIPSELLPAPAGKLSPLDGNRRYLILGEIFRFNLLVGEEGDTMSGAMGMTNRLVSKMIHPCVNIFRAPRLGYMNVEENGRRSSNIWNIRFAGPLPFVLLSTFVAFVSFKHCRRSLRAAHNVRLKVIDFSSGRLNYFLIKLYIVL